MAKVRKLTPNILKKIIKEEKMKFLNQLKRYNLKKERIRNISESKILNAIIEEEAKALEKIQNLHTAKKVLKKRIRGRR